MEQSTQALAPQDGYNYASVLVRQRMRNEAPEDICDIVQEAVIKLWVRSRQNSGKTEIVFPEAYLRRIVQSRCIDRLRRRKGRNLLPLVLDADGEIAQGQLLCLVQEGCYQDPARAFELKELLEETIARIVQLPTRQRYAMICTLKDEVDDTFPLAEVFKGYDIDIEPIHWPQEAGELHKLRCCCTFARKTLRSLQK